MSVYEKMTAIADRIRGKTGKTGKLNLDAIASGVDEVYDAGVKSEYDKFWDRFQDYGQRTSYDREGGRNFTKDCWSFKNFYPKYNLSPVNASQMFYNWKNDFGDEYIGDIAQRLEDCGVVLDISNATNCYGIFQYCSGITRVPALDFSNAPNTKMVFYECNNLKTIDKLTFNEKNTSTEVAFSRCSSLENVVFDGVLAVDLDIHWSPLTHDSIISLLNILKDFSGSGTTRTLTLGTSNLAKLTDTEKAIATNKGWTLA